MIYYNAEQVREALSIATLSNKGFEKEWVSRTYFAELTGGSPNNVVRAFKQEDTGKGVSYNFDIAHTPYFNILGVDGQEISGHEADMTFGGDYLSCGLNAIAIKVPQLEITEASLKKSVIPLAQQHILDARALISPRRMHVESVALLLANCNFRQKSGANISKELLTSKQGKIIVDNYRILKQKIYEKILNIKLVDVYDELIPKSVGQFPRARIMFGDDNLAALNSETIREAISKLTNNDIMSYSSISNFGVLHDEGARAHTGATERKIAPFEHSISGPYRLNALKKLLAVSHRTYLSMVATQGVFCSQLARNITEDPRKFSIYTTTNYKGTLHDIDIMIDHDLSAYETRRDDGSIVVLSLMYGASAIGYLQGFKKIATEVSNYGTSQGWAHKDFMDCKGLTYGSENNFPEGGDLYVEGLRVPVGVSFMFSVIPAPVNPAPVVFSDVTPTRKENNEIPISTTEQTQSTKRQK